VGSLNLSALADGPISLNISQSDSAGNQTLINRQITKDTIAPSVSIASPLANSMINSISASNFLLSGTCSESALIVNIV